jgi:cytochrome b561
MLIAVLKYPLTLRLFHWLIAILIIGLLCIGLYMSDLSRDNPNRALLYSLHKSFGVTVLFLSLLRIGIRLTSFIPPLPEIIPVIERRLAHASHYLFYGFMIAIPVSGYAMTNSFGFPVKWFGISLPILFPINKSFGALANDFHSYAAFTLIGLICLHIAGVIKHYWKERLNLLTRII